MVLGYGDGRVTGRNANDNLVRRPAQTSGKACSTDLADQLPARHFLVTKSKVVVVKRNRCFELGYN